MKHLRAGALRPGDTLDVTIEKAVYRGQGLARHEGQVIFIPRAVPGDRVQVRVQATRPGYVRAIAQSLLEPGEGRREAPCAHFVTCGGCTYQDYDYGAQLRLKEGVLRDALSRARVDWPGDIRVHGSPERAWRTRASLHFQGTSAGLQVGFHQEGTNRVVPLGACLQLSEAMNRTALALRDAVHGDPRLLGRVQGLDLTEAFDGSSLVASLDTNLEAGQATGLAAFRELTPWLSGLGAMVGGERQRRFLLLAGDPRVEASVAGFRLRHHVHSFFQGNRFLAEPLVQAVLAAVPPGGSVLDLYSGVGLFTLPLAARAAEVHAVELSAPAVEDARLNAAANDVANVRFLGADVQEALMHLPPGTGERVVLDPPRAGAGPEVIALLAARAPSVIAYVSCDPATLARDLRQLGGLGYALQGLEAFDLFPDTFHLETLATLRPLP